MTDSLIRPELSRPEAIDAQKSLDALVGQWEAELQKMQTEWKRKFDDYDKKKLILTDQIRAEQEKELRDMDQAIAEYRNKKFGQNGELFQKLQERLPKALVLKRELMQLSLWR